MLVLSRKENESIVINGNIKIVVAEIQRGRVVHFEDGQTQQWLLVRMDDPDGGS